MSEPVYALDDRSALKVIGSEVSIITEGTVKVYNASFQTTQWK